MDAATHARLKLQFRALLHGKFSVRDVKVAEDGGVTVLIHEPTQNDVAGVLTRILAKSDLEYWNTGHGRDLEGGGYYLRFAPKKEMVNE